MRGFSSRYAVTSLVAVGLLALAACRAPSRGSFGPTGFSQDIHGYRVRGTSGSLLSDDWILDNYYRDQESLQPKRADQYLIRYAFDLDGDGTFETHERQLLYDLRYTHKKHDAVIWLRTIPIASTWGEKDLRVIMQGYIDAVAGAGYEAVTLEGGGMGAAERRFAAEPVSRGEAKLAGMAAYSATFDVANVDQIKLTPSSRWIRVRIVLARTPFVYEVGPRPQRAKLPVLMLAGYANLPEDFSADAPEFEDFLSRIQINERMGFRSQESPAKSAVDVKAPAETPATMPLDGDGTEPTAPPADGGAAPPKPQSELVKPETVGP